MKTIQERAKDMELWFLRRMPNFRAYRLSKMFEDMLNEQKDIDTKKAVKWLKENIVALLDPAHYNYDYTAMYADFIKGFEEDMEGEG